MAGRRQALIIAVSQYDDPSLPQLIAPEHDAKALSSVLGDKRIGDFEVTTSINQPAHEIRESFDDFFSDSKPDDLKLVYFSGHGIKDSNGQLYFATKNTKSNRLQSTAISAKFFNEIIHQSRSRKKVLILDCCFSGAFAKDMIFRAGSNVGAKEYFNEGKGHLVITASDAMQFAHDADKKNAEPEPSIFTRILVEGLRSGEADRDQSGVVTFDELYEYLHDKVTEKMPGQEPCKWAFQVKGDLVIAKNPKPVAITLPKDLTDLINHPRPDVRLVAVEDLEVILGGDHKGLAKAALRVLEGLADDDSKKVAAAAQKVIEVQGASAEIEVAVIKERKTEQKLVEIKTEDFKEKASKHVVKKEPALKTEQKTREHAEKNSDQQSKEKDAVVIKQVPTRVVEKSPTQETNKKTNNKSGLALFVTAASIGGLVLISVLVSEPKRSKPVYDYTQPTVVNEKNKPLPPVQLRNDVSGLPTLTIVADPLDAKIRILNIKQAYYPGIELKPGYYYDIEVSKKGYSKFRKEIYVGQLNVSHKVVLQKINVVDIYSRAEKLYNDKQFKGALTLFRQAAELGDLDAMNYIGFMYEKGKGVEQDNVQAVKWYRKAAEQGNAYGQANLGFMYENGKGVVQDNVQAVKWYRQAAKQGNEFAKTRLRELGVAEE